jgi:hypothetical protein
MLVSSAISVLVCCRVLPPYSTLRIPPLFFFLSAGADGLKVFGGDAFAKMFSGGGGGMGGMGGLGGLFGGGGGGGGNSNMTDEQMRSMARAMSSAPK